MRFAVFLLLLALTGCASAPGGGPYHEQYLPGEVEEGIASWYHDSLHGNPTASGTPYDKEALTAAHRSMALGSWIEVTNLDNGRKLRLLVNDRGPFVDDRILDVSRRAAVELGFLEQGLARVRIRLLESP